MGNDGGSIPTRRELVKSAASSLSQTQVKEIQTEQQEHYWSTCALSHQPLSPPIVSDGLGTLYNKDAVLDHLLSATQEEKSSLETRGEAFKDRLRSLRDVVEVKFQTEAEGKNWVCPVTGKELGPGVKAVYLVPCGHAFSESVMKEMPGDSCLQCSESYTPTNIIPILPTSQTDKDPLTLRLQTLKTQNLTHSLKKAPSTTTTDRNNKKKRKAASTSTSTSEPNPPTTSITASETPLTTQKSTNTNIKNPSTASLTSKVLAEQSALHKRRKHLANDNVRSLFSEKKANGMEEKHVDFMTRGFSIPANAKR